ncbi:hypothetical protein [Lentibacillus salicampi]|uniref:Uncharacterized protein n=1 Tax=Lentibacillus salicampi TaxID=175306 RepID=A0A4Y9ABS6_9BACI|nr:hypothetical protein [Lentibacillus salicampi]TFJ91834.1 hypothetical protein E4U82_15400 [Lentibacillus salicampi]
MQRYWRLMAVAAVVVLTIGTFYIQSAIAANGLPEITVEKVSGDADEMKPVKLVGNYTFGNGMGESVQVDAEGSTYGSEKSFFERIRNDLFHKKVDQLQAKYKGFMRGKGGKASSYLETEDTLAYADVINQATPGGGKIEFDIAVLDKANDETTSFTVPVPNRAMYVQVQVQDVQMTEDALNVITSNYLENGGTETHHYRFDIAKQDITDENMILSDKVQEDKRTHSSIVSGSDQAAAYDEIIFKKTVDPIIERTDQGRDTASATGEQEYIVYNPETEETRTLEFPGSLADQNILDRSDTMLYFKDQQQIVQYDMETEQMINEMDIPTSFKKSEKWGGVTRIKNDTAYMLTRNQEEPRRLAVLDLPSGDILFEGKIKLDDPVDKNASLSLNELQVE